MNFLSVIVLSSIIGLSIFLSYPFILMQKMNRKATLFLTAIAVGILVFLISDIFSDVSLILYNNTLYGYGTNAIYDFLFTISLLIGFLMLYIFEFRSKIELKPVHLSLMISIGIGLQNLTEGLVFGSEATLIGFSGIALVIFTGFIIQNITEGFPIGAPFFDDRSKSKIFVPVLFLIGGLPTIIGGSIGYYFNSVNFELVFDGLAIGSILYIIIAMGAIIFRDIEKSMKSSLYIGVLSGFLIGLIVNLF